MGLAGAVLGLWLGGVRGGGRPFLLGTSVKLTLEGGFGEGVLSLLWATWNWLGLGVGAQYHTS